MKTLMILRHAKAEPHAPERDHERQLSASGRDACNRIGSFMGENLLFPDVILCSDSARTRQTLEGISAYLPKGLPVRIDRKFYQADPPSLLSAVRKVEDTYHKVLLIGHNPACEDFAYALLKSTRSKPALKLKEKFPTGALAILDFSVDQWTDLSWNSGELDLFVAPSEL